MRDLFISAGHSNKKRKDRGAVSGQYVEGELTVEFRNLLQKELNFLCIKHKSDSDSNILSETINVFKNLTNPKVILVDIHFNSFSNKTATGCEVLIPTYYSNIEYNLANDITNTISKVLNIKNRGVKTELESARGKLGWMNLLGENILLEICFISNDNDMLSYNKNKEKLAKEIALILGKYLLL